MADEQVLLTQRRTKNELRKFAHSIRVQFRKEDTLWFPIVQFVEFVLTLIDEDFHFNIVEDSVLPGVYAHAEPEENRITIRRSVYDGAVSGDPKHRMTLAHELGHYLMHTKESCVLARAEPGRKISADCKVEAQAEIFAAELLMPVGLIRKKNLGVFGIQKHCGVTYAAAKNMLKHIEWENRTKKQAKKKNRASKGPVARIPD